MRRIRSVRAILAAALVVANQLTRAPEASVPNSSRIDESNAMDVRGSMMSAGPQAKVSSMQAR